MHGRFERTTLAPLSCGGKLAREMKMFNASWAIGEINHHLQTELHGIGMCADEAKPIDFRAPIGAASFGATQSGGK